jgi:hypothetical protein
MRGRLRTLLPESSNGPCPRFFRVWQSGLWFAPFTWNCFLFFALSRLVTRERTMTSQNECPSIEEMISDEVRRRFGARTFQTCEKRPETEKRRSFLRFLKLPIISRLAHAAR